MMLCRWDREIEDLTPSHTRLTNPSSGPTFITPNGGTNRLRPALIAA
jgi:hypothetical protein